MDPTFLDRRPPMQLSARNQLEGRIATLRVEG